MAGEGEARSVAEEPNRHRHLIRAEPLGCAARYTASGFLDIDNNVAEQEMKNIAIGRKNWLFVGSENGGKTAAVLFSVASSCRRHGHDTFAYVRDVPDAPAEAPAGVTGGTPAPPLETSPG